MSCPVCKVKLEFPVPDLEEVYYDCPNCNSSLLFKNGKCEVLNEGQSEKSESQKNQSEIVDFQKKESLQDPDSEETGRKESENNNSLQNEITESVQNEDHHELAESDEEFSKESGLLKEEQLEEEEFVPNETTQVPELKSSEEESSDNFSEQEDLKEKPAQTEAQHSPLAEEKGGNTVNHSSSKEDFSFQEESEKESLKDSESKSQKEDFSEVAEFGNTQDQDKQGPFIYDLTLSEINSQDLREKVLTVLEDESLNLPSKEENHSIKDGEIIIVKISPVQAYVIVTALMGLPLNISWKQHHIADS